MPNYHRNRVPGGTYFFTVNLLDRRSGLLVTHVDLFRKRRSPCENIAGGIAGFSDIASCMRVSARLVAVAHGAALMPPTLAQPFIAAVSELD